MNNSKLWLVVNPTVGIPIFLGAVAVSSFAVHLAVVSTTDIVENYHMGKEQTDSAFLVPGLGSDKEETAKVAFIAPVIPGNSAEPMLVVLPDGSTARVVIDEVSKTSYTPALPEL
ncbi:light-harvesting protein [Pseudaestuariivita sp.]|uniref:light-harvesting protein n=1 Tax=Pseudaestuariivita sp. TaxID=2211669 RepID=UPI004058824A